MSSIKEKLKLLPNKPGVYLMKDKQNKIIYIGKAISLKNRVLQYFRKTNKTTRIEKMVSLINDFEYIITDTEAEALILECNLIKKHLPKFNVLLKDDKTFPYIKIDINSDFPNVFLTRKKINDNSKYFGPYTNITAAKEMLNFIKQKFLIRQCKNFKFKNRECLNYHIKKCSAPCIGLISKENYKKQINQIIMLLDGKTSSILKELDEEILALSKNLEFEKAALLRDRKNAIQAIFEKQKVSNIFENNIDVIGLYANELYICIDIFFVRNSKMIDRKQFFIENLKHLSENEIISGFIKQYYFNSTEIPNKIMIKQNIEDRILLENLLSQQANHKLEIKIPQKR